jgi:hypothetical protein
MTAANALASASIAARACGEGESTDCPFRPMMLGYFCASLFIQGGM